MLHKEHVQATMHYGRLFCLLVRERLRRGEKNVVVRALRASHCERCLMFSAPSTIGSLPAIRQSVDSSECRWVMVRFTRTAGG